LQAHTVPQHSAGIGETHQVLLAGEAYRESGTLAGTTKLDQELQGAAINTSLMHRPRAPAEVTDEYVAHN
jgi:hypothetical protein